MGMLEDRRNINRFAMVAIAFLFLSFAVETLPDVGPLPFLLTLGAIFFSLMAIAVSWRVSRRPAAESDGAERDGSQAEPDGSRTESAENQAPSAEEGEPGEDR
jgi:hypothetical protein